MEEIKSYQQVSNSKENSPLKRIGSFIKEARLSRNQSIEDLASNLKIGEHQLKAIEEGNEEKLPEKVFIKAMIRRIAQKLKLDTEFIMDEFKTERKEVKIEEIIEEVSKKNYKSRQSKNLNPVGFLIFILISGFLGLVASSLILRLAASLDQRPDKVISSVQIKLEENILIFELLPFDRNHDLLLEKWNLGLCRNVIKELKNLDLKVI